MKKFIAFLMITVALVSCYEDYILDYEFDGIYFPYQLDVRTVVVGEGMKFNYGVALGGVRDNNRDREVTYQLDNSLVNDNTLAAMKGGATYIKNSLAGVDQLRLIPSNYYTVSDASRFVIKKGEYTGTVTFKADSAKFVSDPATLEAGYVLPLRITAADADSLLSTKDYLVVGVKYENMLFGNYWHGGVTVVKDAAGSVVETVSYPTTIPSPDSKAWALKTVGPMSLVTNGVSDVSSSSNAEFKITLSGGNITIESQPDAAFQVMPDGASTYNQAKLLQDRRIYLNYKYQREDGNWCYAKDTLTFRNRIRDGVNEWQDENPDNYK